MAQPGGGAATAELEIAENDLLLALTGPGSRHLRIVEKELGVQAGVRGNRIRLQGEPEAIERAERALMELLSVAERGRSLDEREVRQSLRMLRHTPEVKLTELVDHPVLVARRKTIVPKGLAQKVYVDTIRKHDIVFGVGPAGTGKTYLAMAMAVRALGEKQVKRIILTRPAVEAGEKLGFLPGDLAEKVNPYLRPLYDALHDMMELERVQLLIERGTVEVAPLAFMRGRTLNDCFVILDEAQNSTRDQMKMFLTRLGFGSKAVITGDVTQVDLPEGARSGLADAVGLLGRIEGIGVCRFTDADVVRHPLVAKIVRAYDARDARDALTRALSQAPTESLSEGPLSEGPLSEGSAPELPPVVGAAEAPAAPAISETPATPETSETSEAGVAGS